MTNDYIAYVRLNAEHQAGLEIITEALPGTQAAHIRQAVREYLARILPTLAHPPVAVPAAAVPAADGEIRLREVGQ